METERKRDKALVFKDCRGGRDSYARLRLKKMSEGKHPHPDNKAKRYQYLDGASAQLRQELADAVGACLEEPAAQEDWKEAAPPERLAAKEEDDEAGSGNYGVKLPLLGLDSLCLAYGNTADGLLGLGRQARRRKAEKAADRQEEEDLQAGSRGWKRPPKQRRAGAQVRARRR